MTPGQSVGVGRGGGAVKSGVIHSPCLRAGVTTGTGFEVPDCLVRQPAERAASRLTASAQKPRSRTERDRTGELSHPSDDPGYVAMAAEASAAATTASSSGRIERRSRSTRSRSTRTITGSAPSIAPTRSCAAV